MYVKYHECGYSVIPVIGKRAFIKDWTKWCLEKQPIELIEQFENVHSGYNIGICCGPASGIVALDIDTDDKEILSMCPPSHVIKRGSKGETRFFQYDPSIISQSLDKIDILSTNRMTVVPPSIHPETKEPYIWLTEDTLDSVAQSDLPFLDTSFIDRLNKNIIKKSVGRNNKLTEIVSAMFFRGEDLYKIINEAYAYDLNNHSPRLFVDRKEGFTAADEERAKQNAGVFVSRIATSLFKSGKVVIQDTSESEVIVMDAPTIKPAWQHEIGPVGTGLLKTIHDTVLKASPRDMPNLATGAAIALIGTFACNRFRSNAIWPNVYVLNIAGTAMGKSFPAWVANKLIMSIDSSLKGSGSYASTQGFLNSLYEKKERLDVIDEFSVILKQITERTGPTARLGEELCSIYTASDSFRELPRYSRANEDAPTMENVFNPCVNILGSTTKDMLIKYLTKEMVFSGVMNRFLIFTHEGITDPKWGFKKELDSDLFNTMKFDFKTILDVKKTKSVFEPDFYDPRDLSAQGTDQTYLFDVAHELGSQLGKLPGIEGEVKARTAAHVEKLALISAISNGFARINKRDIDFAIGTLSACTNNIMHIFNQGAVDNDWERDLNRVMHFCNTATRNITVSYILNRTRSVDMDRVTKLLNNLEVAGRLVKVKSGASKAWCVNASFNHLE